LIARIKKHPLARAVRADKLCLAALSATLLHYLKNEATQTVPIWRMIAERPQTLRQRAQAWQAALGQGEIVPGLSTIGGGSLPEETLPTFLLALRVKNSSRFLAALRRLSTPVIARLEQDRAVFDPRTVLPEQDGLLFQEILSLLQP
jgi:L-seryl-tRNA(Ser) seleniumtransferase